MRVAARLGAGIVDDVAVYDRLVATKEGTFLTIDIVLLRTLSGVVEIVELAFEAHGHTITAHLTAIEDEVSIEQYRAIGMDGVDEVVGHIAIIHGGDYYLLTILLARHLGCTAKVEEVGDLVIAVERVVRLTGVGSFIFDPTEVVVFCALARIEDGLTIVTPCDDLTRLVVEGHRHTVVAHGHLVVFAFHLEGVHSALNGRELGKCAAL